MNVRITVAFVKDETVVSTFVFICNQERISGLAWMRPSLSFAGNPHRSLFDKHMRRPPAAVQY